MAEFVKFTGPLERQRGVVFEVKAYESTGGGNRKKIRVGTYEFRLNPDGPYQPGGAYLGRWDDPDESWTKVVEGSTDVVARALEAILPQGPDSGVPGPFQWNYGNFILAMTFWLGACRINHACQGAL